MDWCSTSRRAPRLILITQLAIDIHGQKATRIISSSVVVCGGGGGGGRGDHLVLVLVMLLIPGEKLVVVGCGSNGQEAVVLVLGELGFGRGKINLELAELVL